MNNDVLKKKIKQWSDSIGRQEAQKRLINSGLSFSISYQLSRGEYLSDPKERVVNSILKAMGK